MSIYISETRARLARELEDEVGWEEGKACRRIVDHEVCDGQMIIEWEHGCTCWSGGAPCTNCRDSLACSACGYRLSHEGLCP